jgi:hypothetical protein
MGERRMKFTSVVGYHMSPYACGVAKFNAELAKRLGVPFVGLNGEWGCNPLLSLKWSEMEGRDGLVFMRPDAYSVFWHDAGHRSVDDKADVVYYADPSLGPNGLWCPSLLTPSKPRTVRLFSFGMAHKLQTAHYAKVRQLLEAAGLDYRLRVSVGLHEGTSLSDATKHFDALKDIMGADKVTILGCLSDDAVSEELHSADYVLAFFEQGLRANNTTVHAALDAGCRVITNTDHHTPGDFCGYVLDITRMGCWPDVVSSPFTWDGLIEEMERIYADTANRQPIHQR